MRRITWAFVVGIFLILVFIAAAFLYLVFAKPKIEKPEFSITNASEFVLNENMISYVLAEIGAYQLHSPPMSSETPCVEIDVDGEKFYSEVSEGKIITRRSQVSSPDLVISSSESEIENALKSGNVKNYIKNSVSSGKTSIDLKASYSTLFFKGYLTLYKEITGKSFTGSAVRIFGQGS